MVRAEEVNGHAHVMTQNAGIAQSAEEGDVGGHDDEAEDDESHNTDLHESMSVQTMPSTQHCVEGIPVEGQKIGYEI